MNLLAEYPRSTTENYRLQSMNAKGKKMFTWTRSFLENLQKLCKFTLLEVLPLHSTTKTTTKMVFKECKVNQESNNLLCDLSPNPSWNTNKQTKVGGEGEEVTRGAVMNFVPQR
jgi:hypothetical protein